MTHPAVILSAAKDLDPSGRRPQDDTAVSFCTLNFELSTLSNDTYRRLALFPCRKESFRP